MRIDIRVNSQICKGGNPLSLSFHKIWILVLIAIFSSSCAASMTGRKPEEPRNLALRVGVCPHYPPLIFKQGEQIQGVDADLARRLASVLGLRVEFIELERHQLVPALMEDQVDIVMSGMTITELRKVRTNFAEPYLKVGLATLMRAEDAARFNSQERITGSLSVVGVVQGTTGEAFVRKNFSNAANIISVQKAHDASILLITRKIDLFVHDSPSVLWLGSENEGLLNGYWEPFHEEFLGWAVKRGNDDLLSRVNSILRNWKENGTLKEVLTKWLPYLKNQV